MLPEPFARLPGEWVRVDSISTRLVSYALNRIITIAIPHNFAEIMINWIKTQPEN